MVHIVLSLLLALHIRPAPTRCKVRGVPTVVVAWPERAAAAAAGKAIVPEGCITDTSTCTPQRPCTTHPCPSSARHSTCVSPGTFEPIDDVFKITMTDTLREQQIHGNQLGYLRV